MELRTPISKRVGKTLLCKGLHHLIQELVTLSINKFPYRS